jgi:hypothetical protein
LEDNPIEEFLKDPDRRAKLYLILVAGMILSTIFITIGMIIFILHVLKIF